MNPEFKQKFVAGLQPAPEKINEGIVRWAASPKSPVVQYIRFLERAACKVNVRAAHDQKLVLAFLTELAASDLSNVTKDHPCILTGSKVLASTPLSLRGLAHPSLLNGTISRIPREIGDATYTTFPAHPCEFAKDDSRDDFSFRLSRVVQWSNWDRQPAPALSARYLRQKTGIKSTGGKRMGIFPLIEIERIIGYIATDDGFIEVENFERRQIRIDHVEGKFQVTLESEKWMPSNDGLIPWFKIFATEGWDTALKARKEYGA